MTYRYFHYLSPKILPTFPAQTGDVVALVDPQHILRTRAYRDVSGTASLTISSFWDGKQQSQETLSVRILYGVAQDAPVLRRFSSESLGYVEFNFEMPEPVFIKILPEPGYAILDRPGQGAITVNADMKYANPRTIQQIRSYGEFSMIHSGVFWSAADRVGNSLLLINPYDKPLLARITDERKNTVSQRVDSRSAKLVDLSELVPEGEASTVIVTASNRVITYDVKHRFGDPSAINNIDHLDPFSGYSTHAALTPLAYGRRLLVKASRVFGLRHA